MSIFELLLDVIESKEPVSQSDYHNVVQCIRAVFATRDGDETLSDTENTIILARGYNPQYNPFSKPVERVRFGMCFCDLDNPRVATSIAFIKAINFS